MYKSNRHVPLARGAIVLATLLLSGLLTVAMPGSAAAGVTVTPNVPMLPAGALPHLPYVDWAAKRIVDGSRRVSIAGIHARMISLHKVDGGYLLGRESTSANDLVFVSNSGARRVLVRDWQPPRRSELDTGLAVSHYGDKVVVNTATRAGGGHTYVDTRVVSLPSGQLLRTRDFGSDAPKLLGFGINRAMLTISSQTAPPPAGFYPDTRWWNPATNAVTSLRDDAAGESADLGAWQWAIRPQVGVYSVQGIPPDTEPDWPVAEEDIRLGPWSPNDVMVAGNNEVTEEEASAYLVYRTSDGERLLSVIGNQEPQITWESDSALLLRTRIEGTNNYQLIRCTMAGSCQRVGPTSDRFGVILPASRRNS